MKKKYIIPIFVPHLGCPNKCTFCNQSKISGQLKNITSDDVKRTVDEYLENFKDNNIYKEIAFFGGSFTGIDIKLQNELLETANLYIKSKKVKGIRISTRPDYIDKQTLKRLKKYHVKTIELGVQTTDNYILRKCKRGHTYEDVVKASKLIRRYGFTLGHQMMVGLPESTRRDELNTAYNLAKLKPKIVRIYPVLVIKGTELEDEYNNGNFNPIELSQAVEVCKELLIFFEKRNINVIRIGLQNTDTITNPGKNESDVVAGPYHENIRQLVESSYYYDIICDKIRKINTRVKEIEIQVNPKNVSEVSGYKRENIIKIKENYDLDVKIKQNSKLKKRKIKIIPIKKYKEFADDVE